MSLSPALKKANKIKLAVNIDDEANLTLLLDRGSNKVVTASIVLAIVVLLSGAYSYFFDYHNIAKLLTFRDNLLTQESVSKNNEKYRTHSLLTNTTKTSTPEQSIKQSIEQNKFLNQESNKNVAKDFSTNFLRAQLTNGINMLEPVDQVSGTVFSGDDGKRKIYFFTQLINLRGQNITHQWFYGGQLRSQLSFNVGGDHWRVNSSIKLNKESEGDWRVIVINEKGEEMLSREFEYRIPRT